MRWGVELREASQLTHRPRISLFKRGVELIRYVGNWLVSWGRGEGAIKLDSQEGGRWKAWQGDRLAWFAFLRFCIEGLQVCPGFEVGAGLKGGGGTFEGLKGRRNF